jgi:hypothetical protein
VNSLGTRTSRLTVRRYRPKSKISKQRKINTQGLVVDLSEMLTRSVTKSEMVQVAKLLRPAWIEVLSAKEGRRWRVKLTSSRIRCYA